MLACAQVNLTALSQPIPGLARKQPSAARAQTKDGYSSTCHTIPLLKGTTYPGMRLAASGSTNAAGAHRRWGRLRLDGYLIKNSSKSCPF